MFNLTTQPLTMGSMAIAKLVELRHDNVRRTIETLAERGVIALPQFEEVSNDGPGPKTIKEYRVSKRDSYVVVAQLSPEFTARLVDRWQQLEEEVRQPAIPQTLPDALRLAADLADQKAEAEAKLAIAGPKAEALDRIATVSEGSFCIREAAKLLQIQEKKLITYLQSVSWIYRHPMGKTWLAHVAIQKKGYLEHKLTEGDKADGTRWHSVQVRITAKGMAELSMQLGNIAA